MNDLFYVAEHLSDYAMKCSREKESTADAFARSTFNRYYYAIFLSVRDFLVQINQEWSMRHKDLPIIFEKSLTKRFKKAADKQRKCNILSGSRSKNLVHEVLSASSEIAQILRSLYGIRVVADYEPDKLVEFFDNGDKFCLINHSHAEVKSWIVDVERNKGILLKVAKELGFVYGK